MFFEGVGFLSLKLSYGRHFSCGHTLSSIFLSMSQVLPLLLLFFSVPLVTGPSFPFHAYFFISLHSEQPLLTLWAYNCCPSQGILLLCSPSHPPAAPSKRSSTVNKDRFLQGTAVFTMQILGARRVSEHGPGANRQNSHAGWLCYGSCIVKGNRIYVKLLCCVRKSS